MKGKGRSTSRQPATKFPQLQKKLQMQQLKLKTRNTTQFRGGRSGSK